MSSIVNKVKDALNPDKSHGSDSHNSESHSQRTNDQYDDPSNSRVGGAQQQQSQQGAVGSGRNTRSSAAAAGGLDEFSSAGGAGYNTNDANYSNTGRVGPGAAGNLNAASSGVGASDPTFASSGRSGRTAGAGTGAGYGESDPTFASSGRTTGAGAGGYDNVGSSRVGGANTGRTGGTYDNVGNAGHNNPDDWSGTQGQTGARTAGNTGNNPSDWAGVRGSDDPTFASTGRTGAGTAAGNTGLGGHRDVGGDVRQQASNAQRGAQSNQGSHLQQGGLRNTVDDIKDTIGGNRGSAGGNNYPGDARDPTDASQVPPSVLAKHIGEPSVDHGDSGHNRARRNSSATHQESFRGI
ncbi:cell surface protein [Ophiostoma piceae UAMH 11346]|uniref:Cell surface protein n=1 Tax=Ophiostoma piceae (strain UAMH 11346) TaxID=1262450 RepID=S3DAR1_OPHP1|nr:cell surface protein [Ophiostoma piceae UAMH 11346]